MQLLPIAPATILMVKKRDFVDEEVDESGVGLCSTLNEAFG